MSGDGRGDPGAASWGEYMKDNPLARRIKEWQTGLSSKLSFGSRDGAGRYCLFELQVTIPHAGLPCADGRLWHGKKPHGVRIANVKWHFCLVPGAQASCVDLALALLWPSSCNAASCPKYRCGVLGFLEVMSLVTYPCAEPQWHQRREQHVRGQGRQRRLGRRAERGLREPAHRRQRRHPAGPQAGGLSRVARGPAQVRTAQRDAQVRTILRNMRWSMNQRTMEGHISGCWR